jgi:hypothetical protein
MDTTTWIYIALAAIGQVGLLLGASRYFAWRDARWLEEMRQRYE